MTKTLYAALFAAMLALNFTAAPVHAAQSAPKAAAAPAQDTSLGSVPCLHAPLSLAGVLF